MKRKFRKQTWVAWIGKTTTSFDPACFKPGPQDDPELLIRWNLYWLRGTKEDWPEGEWPPKKLRITVEEL